MQFSYHSEVGYNTFKTKYCKMITNFSVLQIFPVTQESITQQKLKTKTNKLLRLTY